MKGFILGLLLVSTVTFAVGKLQNEDFKTETELVTAGGTKAQLLNDTKIYVTASGINKTLDDAIVDGDIGGGGTELTAKGNLIGFGTATEECVLDKTDGKLLTVDSTATCGFDFKDAPVSTTLTTKGELQTFDGSSNIASDVCADGEYLVWDSSTSKGTKCSNFLTGILNPVTDWEEFTPTTNITNATIEGWKRLVGDTLEVKMGVTFTGTPSSVTFTATLPDLLEIDTAKLAASTSDRFIGKLSVRDSSASSSYAGSVLYASTTTVNLGIFDDNATGSRIFTINQSTPITFGNNDRIYFEYSVPVVGKTSGLEAVVENKKLAYVEAKSNSGEAITAGSENIPFIEISDVDNLWNGTQFTVPENGIYLITGQIFSSANVSGITAQLFIDGASSYSIRESETATQRHAFSKHLRLLKDEVLSIRTQAAMTLSSSTVSHHLTITQLPENFAIAGIFGECETKFLTSDVTTNVTDITSIKYTNLEIGKTYKVCTTPSMLVAGGDALTQFRAKNNGVNVVEFFAGNRAGAAATFRNTSCSPVFTAAATDLIWSTGSISAGSALQGDGTINETWVELCEDKRNTNQ